MSELFQSVPFAIVLLVIGFVLLVKGADGFVEGCSSIAKRFKVPSIIIGMTIVAMGTSLPETAVSITAAVKGNNALAISNAVGSNIFNLMVVIGICAILTPVVVQAGIIKRDIPFSLICAVLLLVLGAIGMLLGHLDGGILLVLFTCFILYMIRSAQKAMNQSKGLYVEKTEKLMEVEELPLLSVPKSLLFIIVGAAAISLGSNWVVNGASTIASAIGVSQNLIGLTLVAFGTSLPELVTSITAAKKKDVDMALGNAIGSNVFNILMVLGIAGAISPISFIMENVIDIIVLIACTVLVWSMAYRNKQLHRKDGIIMVVLYVIYVVYICMR